MVRDIWDWSEKKSLERIIFESNDAQWLDMVLNPVKGEVKCSKCSAKVNCLANCLANRAEGENVVWRGGALPHGFQRLMELEGIPHFSGVEDSSTQGDASSAAPISMGLQTPVRVQGTGLCLLNTEQATIPTVSPVAHNTKAPVTKRTRRTRSASEQSNVAGFYREASDDDDDSDSSVAGRVAIFESAGRNREFVGGHGSPPKTSKVPFGGRITRSQIRPEQSSAAVGTPISSQSPSF
nr:uncharacterized protein LOC109173561 [Ipomoea batatas]